MVGSTHQRRTRADRAGSGRLGEEGRRTGSRGNRAHLHGRGRHQERLRPAHAGSGDAGREHPGRGQRRRRQSRTSPPGVRGRARTPHSPPASFTTMSIRSRQPRPTWPRVACRYGLFPESMSIPKVILKSKRAQPFFGRHPWVYAGAIDRIEGEPSDGDEVELVSSANNFVARGLFNSQSKIQVRLYSWEPGVPLDRALLPRAGSSTGRPPAARPPETERRPTPVIASSSARPISSPGSWWTDTATGSRSSSPRSVWPAGGKALPRRSATCCNRAGIYLRHGEGYRQAGRG